MKRIRIWINELSLSQQLLTIIFLVVTAFSVFFFVFLTNNVNDFVSSEMFRILHRSQDTMNYYIASDTTNSSVAEITDANVMHLLYDKNTGSFSILGNSQVASDVIADMAYNIQHNDIEGYVDFTYSTSRKTVLYTVSQATYPNRDNYYIISVVSDTYRNEFKAALVNSVINLNVFVVSALFIILMIWVASLIHPLNQIRNYIDKIKNGEEANLNIPRRDEIGEVAGALVDMEEELNQQKHIREEMIQNISHDLKTPIATIKSYSESIKDGIYPYDTLEKSVDVIIEHANRLEKKVYSLLMLNKMGYLQDEAEEGETLEMKKIIEKVILSLKVIRPEIEMKTQIDDNAKFHGDEESWRIVVENLIDNALRYAKSEIVITLKQHELLVSNDGDNISKENIEKIFRPYEKGTDGQFGLGLSIVYKVCTIYGYNVNVDNLSNGVCFKIKRMDVEIQKDKQREKEAQKALKAQKESKQNKKKR